MMVEATFPVGLPSAAEARHLTEHTLRDWQCEALIDTAGLLVSELVVNSTMHARTPCVLRLILTDGQLRVEVQDRSQALPEPRHLSLTAPNGRGLIIVDALADAWGATVDQEGKTVWFHLAADPSASSSTTRLV